MRLRHAIIGALNLFGSEVGALADDDAVAGQALADVATIAILQQRAFVESHVLNEQLNHALSGRLVIEQAKGVLAERSGLTMELAFETMRRHARANNRRLVDVAQSLVDKNLAPRPSSPPAQRSVAARPEGWEQGPGCRRIHRTVLVGGLTGLLLVAVSYYGLTPTEFVPRP